MFHTNFDDLESSLDNTLDGLKKKELLKEASLAKNPDKMKIMLREQLEDQSKTLNRIKDNFRELRQEECWAELEIQAKELLNVRTLFTEEQKNRYEAFKASLTRLITAKRNEIEGQLNEKLIEKGQEKADRSHQVKIYKNWTSV
jgi:hypothetical protein